jgi:hypothetical protein
MIRTVTFLFVSSWILFLFARDVRNFLELHWLQVSGEQPPCPLHHELAAAENPSIPPDVTITGVQY